LRPGRFTPGETASVPIAWEDGWAQSRSERGGKEKIFLPRPYRKSNPGRPARSLVTKLTE